MTFNCWCSVKQAVTTVIWANNARVVIHQGSFDPKEADAIIKEVTLLKLLKWSIFYLVFPEVLLRNWSAEMEPHDLLKMDTDVFPRSLDGTVVSSARCPPGFHMTEFLSLVCVLQCIEGIVAGDDYDQSQVNKWTAGIVERCLTQLVKQSKPYKYIGTCVETGCSH